MKTYENAPVERWLVVASVWTPKINDYGNVLFYVRAPRWHAAREKALKVAGGIAHVELAPSPEQQNERNRRRKFVAWELEFRRHQASSCGSKASSSSTGVPSAANTASTSKRRRTR
jgi:hypothetical protein